MKKVDIESIPQLVKEARLSYQQAIAIIWEDIYRHPFRYSIGAFNDDEKSEFLLTVYKKLETLIRNFKPGTCQFRTYISGYMRNASKSWYRNNQHQIASDMLISMAAQQEYESAAEKYMHRHSGTPAVPIPPQQGRKSRKRRIAEKTALILLLRACADADDALITTVARYTGTEKEQLWNMVQRLKFSMMQKESHCNLIRSKRDTAYYFHQKYAILLRQQDLSSDKHQDYQQRLEEHTNRWKKWNERLSHRFLCSPSTDNIAEELGMTPRQVYYYINHALNKHAVCWDYDKTSAESNGRDEAHSL